MSFVFFLFESIYTFYSDIENYSFTIYLNGLFFQIILFYLIKFEKLQRQANNSQFDCMYIGSGCTTGQSYLSYVNNFRNVEIQFVG